MPRFIKILVVSGLSLVLISGDAFARGRGGGGRGGGGRVGGGARAGGGFRGGGGGRAGGGNFSGNRGGSLGGNRGGSLSRPQTRPSTRPGGFDLPSSRPSTLPSTRPGTLPGGGSGTRPGGGDWTGGNRPGWGSRPDNGLRPGDGNRPGWGDRPDGGLRPGDGNRPGWGNRPGDGDRPGWGNRPVDGDRPNRPDGGWRPGDGDRPNRPDGGWRPGDGNRPDWDGQRPGWWDGNRPGWAGNRPWYDNHYHYHWYHGYWHNHWYPVAWGAGLWGLWALGPTAYYSGYYPYVNPYYVQSPVVYEVPAVNYSQPINVQTDDTGQQQPPPQAGVDQFDRARESFKAGDYDTALALTNAALKEMPNDSVLHEFRALVLFAKGDYTEAAAAINAVLAVGPGWDWTTMISLYPDANIYTQQLRSLENYTKEHPDDAAAHFLLAYQYITCGHNETAVAELKKVVKLQPNDQVAARLLQMFQPEDESAGTATAQAPPAATPDEPGDPVAPEAIVGTWTADRGDQGKIELTLEKGNRFTWKYISQGKTQEFDGTYTVGGNILTLVNAQGQPMVGTLTGVTANGFNFKLTGGDPNDPGLNFAK